MAVELRVDTHVHSAAAPLKCYTRDQPLFELPLNTFALRVDIPAVFHSPAAAGLARERARRQRAKPVDQPPASSGVVCANSSARFHFFSLPRHRRTCGTFNFEASNPTTGTPLYFLQMPVKHADPWLPHADRTRICNPRSGYRTVSPSRSCLLSLPFPFIFSAQSCPCPVVPGPSKLNEDGIGPSTVNNCTTQRRFAVRGSGAVLDESW